MFQHCKISPERDQSEDSKQAAISGRRAPLLARREPHVF